MKDIQDGISYKSSKRRLRTVFILMTTAVMMLVVTITILLEWAVMNTGWVDAMFKQPAWLIAALSIGFTSVFTGIALAYGASRIILRPMNDLLDGMSKLSKGEFDTRLYYKGPRDIQQIYEGFNALAQELQGVELLRSDFINNFSHEFKTPINSINGLIGLIKEKELPRDKQLEYLGIIEEETDRLSLLTTNILNMTKLESQAILTDKSKYNVSEQIRMCVLMLEKQWTQKKLDMNMEFDDYVICADEDMMKHVWLNILDNAVKFAYDGGSLGVAMAKKDGKLTVEISNSGPEIPEADRDKIFNKFYRTEQAHNVGGNGIGLSIVKSIVELHGGNVSAGRKDDKTIFTVVLPM